MTSRFLLKTLKSDQNFKRIFPLSDFSLPALIHPTAVYEDTKGELYILKINGLQPKSTTDFFILWQQRLMASALI